MLNLQNSLQNSRERLVRVQETIRRRSIRRSLTEWCRHCGYEPARHHRLLIAELEALARGDNDRLAIFMPPGSAKSTYASILFPPWFLAQQPDAAIIAASNTAELAETWGRKVRNLVMEHSNVLNVHLSEDSRAVGRWETTKGGIYYAAGVGGTIVGRRADLVVIDDPISRREDLEGEHTLEKQWTWYTADVYSRLKPKAKVVLIETRYHEDDLAGRVLEQMAAGGDRWRVISLPALAEGDDALGRQPGEALWPEWEPLEALERKRLVTIPRDWAALYQQRPAPEEGDYFKRDWLRPYTAQPALDTLAVYGGSDYAVTADGGDYTVHIVVGVDPLGRMYLLDIWRKQTASDEWAEAFCAMVKQWKPREWAEEQGQIKSGVGPFLEKMQRDRKAWVYRRAFPTRGDKAVRAQSIRGRMAIDGLYVPIHAAWFSDFRHELLSFPNAKHDDQVDAMGLIGQLLDTISVGNAPVTPEKRKPDDYKPMTSNTPQMDDWKGL